MKSFLQNTICRLHALLLFAVMAVAGVSAWADNGSAQSGGSYIEFALPGEVDDIKEGVSFSISMDYMKTYRPESGLNVYSSSWYFTINSSVFDINKVELFEGDGATMTYLTSDPLGCTTDGPVTTWKGNASSVKFQGQEGWTGDYYINKVRVYLNRITSPITYTVNFVGEVPEGCKVNLAGTDFASDGTLPDVMRVYDENDMDVTTTEDYYADVAYNSEDHTFTVEFKHWYYYNVIVNHVMGALEYAGTYKGDGSQFKSKTRIEASAFSAYDLTGYDESIRVTGFGYNYTVTVSYTESAPTDYYIVFPEGTPAGTIVIISDQSYQSDGIYSTPFDVRAYEFAVLTPDGYYADDPWNCFDAETRTFTVRVYEYYHYTVNVTGHSEGRAIIDGYYYSKGQKIERMSQLSADDILTLPVDRYDTDVTISGKDHSFTVKVTYSPYPTLAVSVLDSDADGNYWATFSSNKPFSLPQEYTPYIVTGVEDGLLTIQGFEGQRREYTYDLDFTTGAYSGATFTAMDGNLTVTGVNWIFNTPYGYAETSETEDWTTVTFTLADDFDGIIKSIRFLSATDNPYCWFSYEGGTMGLWSEIPVNAKSMTLGAWYDQMIKHFYLDIEAGATPIIPAGEGILVKAPAPIGDVAYTLHSPSAKTVDTTGNLLVSGDGTVWNTPGKSYYKFAHDTDTADGSAGFYWEKGNGASIQTSLNKAYLVLDAAAADSHYLVRGSGALTGIGSVLAPEVAEGIYNLQGQRVSPVHTSKGGIYVSGGKKVIVK